MRDDVDGGSDVRSRRPRATARLARWSATHPWRAIVGWLAFVVLCVLAGSVAGTRHASSADFRVGEAGRAEALAASGGLPISAVEQVLITARDGGRLDPGPADQAARDLVRRLHGLRDVAEVSDPVRSADGRAVMVTLTMAGDQVAAKKHLGPVLASVGAVAVAHPGLVVAETGDAGIGLGTDQQRADDLLLSEAITLPVTLVILLVVFGALLAAAVPVLLALASIVGSVGLSAVFSHLVPDAGVGAQVIVLMGMAVSVDYSLFYMKRVREELRAGGGALDHRQAVALAAATAGRAVVVSGIGVVVCSACLYAAGDIIFSSLATASIVVVLVAVVSSLTVLPALLAMLGPWTDRLRIAPPRWFGHTGARRSTGGRVWQVLLRPATRHPAITLVTSIVLILALASPALTMRLNQPGRNTFSMSIPAVATYHRLLTAFPDQAARHMVVVIDDPANAEQVRSTLNEVARQEASDPASGDSVPTVRTSSDGRVTIMALAVPYDATSAEATRSLRHLRATILPTAFAQLPDARYAVTGDVARAADYVRSQRGKTPWVVGLVLLLTFVMMALAFRSAAIGAVAVVLNLLSAAAAFGALVLVFQRHWAEHLLDFTSYGFISARVPLFLFVILFGVSMDYQVFLVSRVREAAQRGLSAMDAVTSGITASAGVVTSAAVVMVSVFVSFMFLHLVEVKQIGFGLAVAVLVDAFVVRVMILPAALTLLGRIAWWPGKVPVRPVLSTPLPAVTQARPHADVVPTRLPDDSGPR
jgi:RND superfamily putative drug exporter